MQNTFLGASLLAGLLMVAWGCAVVGWGAGLGSLIGISGKDADTTLGDLGILGLAVLGVLSAGVNFFHSLGGWPAASFFALGLVLLLLRRQLAVDAWNYAPGLPALFIVAGMIAGLSVFLTGPRFVSYFDTQLYHLQTILWARDSRVVLGLANLHTRFGYNSIWLVLSAGLSLPGLSLQTMFLGNSLISIFSALAILQRLSRRTDVVSRIFGAGALLSCFGFISLMAPTSPNTDLAPALLVLEVFYVAVVLATGRNTGADRSERSRELALLLLLSAFAITLKTSQVVVLLVPLALLVAVVRGGIPISWSPLAKAGAFCAILLSTWVARGVALSGCLLYPAASTCLVRLPWSVTKASARHETELIKAWPRTIGLAQRDVLPQGWAWLRPWGRHLLQERRAGFLAVLTIVAVASLLYSLIEKLRRSRTELSTHRAMAHSRLLDALAACAASGIVFSFFTAPDVRFCAGFLAAFPLLIIAITLPVSEETRIVEDLAAFLSELLSPLTRRPRLSALIAVLVILPAGSAHSGGLFRRSDWPSIPPAVLVERSTKDHHTIYVPNYRNIAAHGRCWAAPRPCTPQFDPSLIIGSFGRWQMMMHGAGK